MKKTSIPFLSHQLFIVENREANPTNDLHPKQETLNFLKAFATVRHIDKLQKANVMKVDFVLN